jgi:1,4-dihydroxy-2-naphthoate octaprenyltransferase
MASVIPFALASLLALKDQGSVDASLLALALMGLAAVHLATNMLNDNFDFRSGADQAVRHSNPFAGGSRVLLPGVLSLRAHLALALGFLVLSIAIGLYLAVLRSLWLIPLGLVGVLSSLFYVGPPLRLAHRGVGEALVGLNFGPIIVLGTYLVLTTQVSPGAMLLSLPMGLLVTAILWINEFPDYNSDLAVGKRTLMARLGPQASVKVYAGMVALAYAILALTVVLAHAPPWVLLALLSLPVAAKAIRHAHLHHSDPDALVPANAGTILLLLLFGLLACAGLAVDILLARL